MILRCIHQASEGKEIKMQHKWIPLEKMSPYMPVAVMAGEDQRFLKHHGFDFKEIKNAAKRNRGNSKRKYGASTISQQTAKNVFLWPDRTWVRKGFESYFTVLIELLWSKQRIMEVYLNSIEMGDGIYGVDAVAEHHFNKTPDSLSRSDCALIAATIPNPIIYSSKSPSNYTQKRQRRIEHEMRFIPLLPREGESIDTKTVSGGIYKH